MENNYKILQYYKKINFNKLTWIITSTLTLTFFSFLIIKSLDKELKWNTQLLAASIISWISWTISLLITIYISIQFILYKIAIKKEKNNQIFSTKFKKIWVRF